MLASDYDDDALTKELDPNLDDDYFMLFKRRQTRQQVEKSTQRRPRNYRRNIGGGKERQKPNIKPILFKNDAQEGQTNQTNKEDPNTILKQSHLSLRDSVDSDNDEDLGSRMTSVFKEDSSDEEIIKQIVNIISTDNIDEFCAVLDYQKHSGHGIMEHNLAPYLKGDSFYENVLHKSLAAGALTISKYIIETCPPKLFKKDLVRRGMGEEKPENCLHIIAENNQVELAKMLLERLNIKERKELMYTKGYMKLDGNVFQEVLWFHVACYYGHLDIVKFCLDQGMSPNDADSNGQTGLFWACKANKVEVAEFLLEKNANVNLASNKGTLPLYISVRHGNVRCVKLIMKYNPDVSAKRGVGFETPLILASAFGDDEIAKVLIEHGADVTERTSRGETAMHAAAREGWTTLMELLLESEGGPATINALSKANETPLHYAVNRDRLEAIEFLLENGADSTLKDKHGRSVWHKVIYSHKPVVLEKLMSFTDLSELKESVSPLHLVAETINSKKEFDVIKCYLDMSETDQDGNTFLHLAARHGNYSIVEDGIGIITANIQNSSNNTPLHEAAKAGHTEIVKILLKSCNLNTKNIDGETALHSAINSSNASAEIVKAIVHHTKHTNCLGVLNEVTIPGNTALHFAAKFNCSRAVKYLVDINPSVLNNEGDNASHVATREGNLEALKNILHHHEYEMDINQRTEDGETLLHLAAKNGHVEIIGVLIDFGIDLAIKDDSGNTFLHDLVEQAGSDPDNQHMYDEVFDEVVRHCLKWWCKVESLPIVSEDSIPSADRRKQALWLLRSEIINSDGLTALQLAVKHGASSLVKKMIQVPYVFVQKKSSKMFTYDVTNLLPDTLVETSPSDLKDPKNTIDDNSETNALLIDEDNYALQPMQSSETTTSEPPIPVQASLLEIIVSKRPLNIANVMLDIEPLKQVADGYWLLYQFMTSLLLIVHIVYMSALSAVAIPEIKNGMQLNTSLNTTDEMTTSTETNAMYAFFLLWPAAMLLQEGYYICHRIYRCAKKLDVSEPALDEIRSDPKQSITFSDWTISVFLFYLPHVFNITFGVLVLAWFGLYLSANKYHGVVLAYVMLIGWLTTIAYTRTFRPMHGLIVMLRNIFIKDVLKFLFLYVFILLAFGFAFDCLAQLSPALYAEFNNVGEVFYLTLGMLLGAGDIMVEDIDDKYQESGYSPIHFKLIYLLYALVTVVVLLNILIAMMNDSYGDIKSKEGVSFRVLSIQQAIHFEKSIPLPHSFFTHVRRQQQALVQKDGKWYMDVRASYPNQGSRSDERTAILSKLDKVCQQQDKMADNLNAIRTRIGKLETSHEVLASQIASQMNLHS